VRRSPSLLAGETLVKQGENLGNVEVNVFEVELVLVVLLHLEQVVQLKVEFEKPAVAACSALVPRMSRERRGRKKNSEIKNTYPCSGGK